MRWRYLGLTLVTAAVLLGAWWFLAGGDAETVIRRTLGDMTESASRTASESDVVGLAKLRGLGESFAEDIEAAESPGGSVVKGRREVLRAIAWAREAGGDVRFELEDVEVVVHDAEARAESRFVVRVRGDDAHGLDGTQVTLTWQKDASGWRVHEAFVVRPGG